MQDPKAVWALKAEIERLQDAKRRALAIADERSHENVELRKALDKICDSQCEYLRRPAGGDPDLDKRGAPEVLADMARIARAALN
jgi:hypothetical protein